MSDGIYEQLRKHINRHAVGFNKTESQAEMTLMKRLFTEAHAKMYMLLKEELEPVETIAARGGMNADQASSILAEMTQRGLTFPIAREGIQYYAAAPFVHGMFENSAAVSSNTPGFKDVAAAFRKYMENGFIPTGPVMRAIPINAGVAPSQHKMIAPFENIKK